jgi:phage terminase large subunit-like protein
MVAWDDFMWQDAREELEDEGIPIEVYPQTAERMGKATQRFYEAAVAGLFTHDGDPTAARHIANATLKPTSRGLARIVKESGDSKQWIDSAVADVMGLDRAEWWHTNGSDGGFNIW